MGPFSCAFDAATGRIVFLDPRLADALDIDVPRRSTLRIADLFAELADPTPRRVFACRVVRHAVAIFEIRVRRVPPGPLVASGSMEAEIRPTALEQPSLAALEELVRLREGEPARTSLTAAMTALRAAFGDAFAALGRRSADGIVRVEAVAAGVAWPALGARLRPSAAGASAVELPGEGGLVVLGSASPDDAAPPSTVELEAVGEVLEALAAPCVAARPEAASERARLDAAVAAASSGTARLCAIAVEGIEAIGERAGREVSLRALDDVAERLRALLRRGETFVRLSPSSFALIVPHVASDDDLVGLAHRVEGIVRFPLSIGEYRYVLGARVRVAAIPASGADARELLRDARELSPRDPRDRSGTSGFIACYDPIVALADGRIVGAEALVRRVHPSYGVLGPERAGTAGATPSERFEIARRLVEGASSVLAALGTKGLARIFVNTCLLEPDALSILWNEGRRGEYRMKGLRFELTAQQVESVTVVDGGSDALADIGVSLVAPFAGALAFVRDRTRAVDSVLLDAELVDPARGHERLAHATLAASLAFARTIGAETRVRGAWLRGREATLRRLGIDTAQHGASVVAATELRRLLAGTASGGTA